MAARSKLSNEKLREMLRQGMNGTEIALSMGMTPQAVNQRIAKLEALSAAKAPAKANAAHASMWDTRTAAEENYRRALGLLETCIDEDGILVSSDRLKVVAEIRRHLEFAMGVMETLYSIQEVKAFQEEVLAVLEECEPGARERILERLREKRALRAAFLPN